MRLLNRVDATVKLQICHVACRNGFHSVKQSADRVHAWHIAHLAAQVRTELTSSSNMHKSIEHHAPLTGRVTWRLAAPQQPANAAQPWQRGCRWSLRDAAAGQPCWDGCWGRAQFGVTRLAAHKRSGL